MEFDHIHRSTLYCIHPVLIDSPGYADCAKKTLMFTFHIRQYLQTMNSNDSTSGVVQVYLRAEIELVLKDS